MALRSGASLRVEADWTYLQYLLAHCGRVSSIRTNSSTSTDSPARFIQNKRISEQAVQRAQHVYIRDRWVAVFVANDRRRNLATADFDDSPDDSCSLFPPLWQLRGYIKRSIEKFYDEDMLQLEAAKTRGDNETADRLQERIECWLKAEVWPNGDDAGWRLLGASVAISLAAWAPPLFIWLA